MAHEPAPPTPPTPPTPPAGDAPGRLVDNLVGFGRTLRAAGMPVGPGKTLDAVNAVRAVGVGNRDDFYWALFAVYVNRRDQRDLFDQAFRVYWRNPKLLERLAALALPDPAAAPPPDGDLLARRLAEALAGDTAAVAREERETERREVALSWSARERLGAKDFEQMSGAELLEAAQLLRDLGRNAGLALPPLPTRRFRPDPRGPGAGRRIDLRATLRESSGLHGDLPTLRYRSRRRRPPALVLLCDISGSMGRYSRMLLHFAHALANDRDRVHTFVFGTRLTNITRLLRFKDVDRALAKVSAAVADWDGGTCIGDCLHRFNLDWSRRVLGQGAQVLLISDGLDRDDPLRLAREAERLQKSCRRLTWLNPLLRYDGFQPRARGVRALLPYVDEFRAAHNLNSLADLAHALAGAADPNDAVSGGEVTPWLNMLNP